MDKIPYASNKQTNYENFIAECPWCNEENIFNRRDDLKTLEPISFRTVTCANESCKKEFKINNDSVNSSFEMFLFGCYELIKKKQYMHCALAIAQSYEVFFNLYLRVELLYKPFSYQQNRDISEINKVLKILNEKIERYSYCQMRSVFLNLLISNLEPKNLEKSKEIIDELNPCDPSSSEIESIKENKRIYKLIIKLKNSSVNKLRNSVVHKRAYRPSKNEIEESLKEARYILFGLNRHLKLYDDPNWYINMASSASNRTENTFGLC